MSDTNFSHNEFMRVMRKKRGKIPQDLYDAMMAALDAGFGKAEAKANGDEPFWLTEARSHMGTKEIRGPQHNQKILRWVKSLGGWFQDDETPWCGTFVAYCMQQAGMKVPKHWYRALAWADWGKPTSAVVGSVAVFKRKGGGHVGFVVGRNGNMLYILGGNQSNEVNIQPISMSRLVATRWPSVGVPLTKLAPVMTGGTVSTNEA